MQNQQSLNPPFTKLDEEMVASALLLASFIGWQVAVLNHISKNGEDVAQGMLVVKSAHENITRLMLGDTLPLGDTTGVSMTNATGQVMAKIYGDTIDQLIEAINIKTEASNVTTN